MAVDDRIGGLVSHFESQIQLVSSITSDPKIAAGSSDPTSRIALHKKILFAAIVDSLSFLRFKSEKKLGNKQRFIEMLRLHSDWPEGELGACSA